MSYISQFETGPLTVTGERPPVLDPLVSRLNNLLPSHAESTLEVEARIGMLMRGKSGERISMPIVSETALPPPSDAMHYEFSADVGPIVFDKIKHHLLALSNNSVHSDTHPLFKVSSVKETSTVDEFYERGGDRVRVSLSSDEVVEVISKKRLHVLDVYSGSFSEEPDGLRPFDLRLSVNEERKIHNFVRDARVATGRREKQRFSFELKGFVIDLTRVSARDRSGERVTHEVEVELKTPLLIEQLERKRNGQSHALYEILTDFIFAVRDLAWSFSAEAGQASGDLMHDPSKVKHSDERIRNYLAKVGNVQPLLGDYLYRIANELKSSQMNH